jgi:SAM-dependent methyltransferase
LGRETYCPVCDVTGAGFAPLPDYYRQHAQSCGFVHFGKGEMTAHQTYSCSKCGASDRERLYALWLIGQVESGELRTDARVLHFAPEACLSAMIRRRGWFDYKTADIGMEGVDFRENLMALTFADGSFDFFICSHVLEHVQDDDIAIRELLRVTRVGGGGLLMAPIIVGLPATLEDWTATSDEDRWRLFGQNDHVRLYAHDDYVAKILRNGFHLTQLGIEHFGENTFERLGLKPTSILYIVAKR